VKVDHLGGVKRDHRVTRNSSAGDGVSPTGQGQSAELRRRRNTSSSLPSLDLLPKGSRRRGTPHALRCW